MIESAELLPHSLLQIYIQYIVLPIVVYTYLLFYQFKLKSNFAATML